MTYDPHGGWQQPPPYNYQQVTITTAVPVQPARMPSGAAGLTLGAIGLGFFVLGAATIAFWMVIMVILTLIGLPLSIVALVKRVKANLPIGVAVTGLAFNVVNAGLSGMVIVLLVNSVGG